MTKATPGDDPEDDEFVDRLIEALSEEDWDKAKQLGDQLAAVIGDLVDQPEELVERTDGDVGGSVAAQAHLSEWILIFESRQDFESAAKIELHLIDLFKRDLDAIHAGKKDSPGYLDDAEAIVDQYEVRAIRFLAHMEDEQRACDAMGQAVAAASEFGLMLDDDQKELADELGVGN
ncbi:MAG: hypothetical protein AB8G99_12540 [Planctomycetaceae bacterium]